MTYSRLETVEDYNKTAIAIDDDKNSQSAVKWAVDNLLTANNSHCILVHVQCKSSHLGDNTSMLREGRPPTQQELQQFFLPFRGCCARRGIEVKEVLIHDTDVSSALIDFINHNNIANIVIGSSRKNTFTRMFKHSDTPSALLKSAPESCAVYVISKGKVQTFRLASRPNTPFDSASVRSTASSHSSHQRQRHSPPTSVHSTGSSQSSHKHHSHSPPTATNASYISCESSESQVSFNGSWKSEVSDKVFVGMSNDSINLTQNDVYGYSWRTASPATSSTRHSLELSHLDYVSSNSEISSKPISFQSSDMSYEHLDFYSTPGSKPNSNSSQVAHVLDAEINRMKLELQRSMDLFNSINTETGVPKNMVNEFQRLQTLDPQKCEETKLVEKAELTLVEMEKQKKKVALEATQAKKKPAELDAEDEEESMKNIEMNFRCRRYTIDEIEVATKKFSASQKIGEGGYGPVFKGMLNYIPVAIKIVRPDLSQGQKQFRQEVDVLSSMRHPHIVILLGACPEFGCLVYECMENGSLEDRLFRKNNTPPIPWRTRFNIAYEIATALLFLHETKPEPLVHRDLKPANILLDRNYVSKLSDVGLARLVPPSAANNVTQYRMTAAAGTFCYIDPEYQQTGLLGVKSDLYSFGVVLLQLLTAKPPMGLSCQVEDAIERGTFSRILDPTLTDWPLDDCLSLAKIAIKCCELRKKDRPNLSTVVLPELERLAKHRTNIEDFKLETTIQLPSPVDLISEEEIHSSEVNQYFRKMKVLY